MSRRRWAFITASASLAAASAAVVAVADVGATASRAGAPRAGAPRAGAPRAGAPRGCPLHQTTAPVSSRPGSESALVPSGASTVLVCSYSGLVEPHAVSYTGPPHRLIGDGLVIDHQTVGRLGSGLDAIPPTSPNEAFSCPADFGNQLVAYFRYPAGVDDPVTIGLSGCQMITNGHVRRLGRDAAVINELAAEARPAIVRGRIRVCGGPAPGRCFTETIGGCGPSLGSCSTSDRVAVITATGQRLVTVRLSRARFSVEVPGGSYRLRLLADGRRVHGKVLQTRRATASAGHTTPVTFRFDVP